MLKRDKLISFINKTIGEELINKALIKDEMLNGVQFSGGENVKKVALGVSLNEEFLQKAIEWGSNFCLVHHGFDVRTWKSRYSKYSQKRLKLIFKNDLTIMGFHFALDAHPKLGNNAQIINKLRAKIGEPLYDEWGYTATFTKPQEVHDLAHRCQKIFNHDIFGIEGDSEKVRKIGVVSGGAKPHVDTLAELENKGVELFISGETSESSPHKMKESGISYFVCGHYATEVFGVKALGEQIKKEFKGKIGVQFIDVENPI